VEETTLFIIQKNVYWRVEELLTNFFDDSEVVHDDSVEVVKNRRDVGKEVGKISRVKLSAAHVYSFQLQ
jgi:hypothetical protein